MNIFKIFAILGVLVMVINAGSAHGQALEQRLSVLNETKPLRNSGWNRSSDVLKNRIMDRNNKVIGDLEDIAVAKQGAIRALQVDLNGLQLGPDVFYGFDALGIQPVQNGFVMNVESEKMDEATPQLLAGIETASGPESDMMSIQNLKNSDVVFAGGERLGKVEEIMFDDHGAGRAEALVIRVNYKSVGGYSIAIPFNAPEYNSTSGNRYEVELSQAQADAILEFAQNR